MYKRILTAVTVIVLLCLPTAWAADTSATAAILMDGDTGEVLYEKNPDRQMLIASTTKLMTTLVVLERGGLGDVVTVTQQHIAEGSSMYLKPGDRVTVEELLYGLLLCSGNDAALALADHCGGLERFVAEMNRKAAELGHEIVPPHGSLVPLVSEDEACRQMQGLALKNVELTVLNRKGKAIFREFGEMLFTHFGVSGPLVLSASAHLRNWEKETYRLSIDLKPALDEQKLESRILRDLGEAPNRSVERIFSGLVPHSMVPVILNRLGMDPQQQANAVTREQRRALVQLLKHFTMPVTGPRPVAEAIITSGGVKVGQVQPATMASKLVQGLYFAGEILDVDAYTGGFNLQIAWATGHCAGVSAAEE